MIKGGLARRYAKALLELAAQKQQMAEFGRALDDFVQLLEQNAELGEAFYGKLTATSAKKRVVNEIMGDAPAEVKNLIFVVLDKSRESSLPEVAEAYAELLDEAAGIRQVMVTTAVPLAEKEQGALEQALGTKLGAKIRLKSIVDKSLIGGIMVQIDDTVYDASLRHQLSSLKQSLTIEEA